MDQATSDSALDSAPIGDLTQSGTFADQPTFTTTPGTTVDNVTGDITNPDGTYGGKIQSGYIGETNVERKVGDIWTDDDGLKWEQKKGYKIKLTKTANVGIFKAHCKDCKKGIVKPWDKDTQKADGRCYHYQLN